MILTHGGALSNLPLFLAIDAGLLAARGVDIAVPPLDSFSATANRLRNGTADIGTTGFTQVLADSGDPDPLVIVAGSGIRGMALLGRAGTGLRDLTGAIGTFADDPMQVLLADELARHGRTDRVTLRYMSSLAEAAQALMSGAVAAITTVEPWIGRLVGQGATVLSDGTEVWGGDYPDTALVARRSMIAAMPGQVTSVISAMLEAERMILADPGSAIAAVAHRFPLFSSAELRTGVAGQPPRVDLRGLEGTILDRWSTVQQLAGRPGGTAPTGLIDVTCLVAAMARERENFTSERIIHVH